jgi:hypothetical protein
MSTMVPAFLAALLFSPAAAARNRSAVFPGSCHELRDTWLERAMIIHPDEQREMRATLERLKQSSREQLAALAKIVERLMDAVLEQERTAYNPDPSPPSVGGWPR